MSKFKVGDRVVRTGDSYHGIVKGTMYTVQDCHKQYLHLEEVHGLWTTDRFELVEPAKEEKDMKKFNIGDSVRIIGNDSAHGFEVGDVCKIVGVNQHNYSVVNKRSTKWYVVTEDMELCWEQEMQNFDMKTTPWFIRIENEAQYAIALQWLQENFGTDSYTCYESHIKALTNTYDDGLIVKNRVMWATEEALTKTKRHEIKLNFRTIIDSVEFPEIETEQEKRIRELKETISLAQKQIEEIQKEMK